MCLILFNNLKRITYQIYKIQIVQNQLIPFYEDQYKQANDHCNRHET